MMNKKIKFTTSTLNADDLIPKTCSDWILNSAKHVQIENTDDSPKIDSRILEKSIFDEYSLDDFDWNQFSPIQEYVDSIVEHDNKVIDMVFFDEFRANGYNTPEKIAILFDTHFWELGEMIKNINSVLDNYIRYGIIYQRTFDSFNFIAPSEPVKLTDDLLERIRERMKELYGTVSE